MSNESPMKVPFCCAEEELVVEWSCRIGSVRKSVPSACLRLAGTPRFLRVLATSERETHVVLYEVRVKFRV